MDNIVKLLKSFVYAFNGIVYTVKNERNMRIHLVCMTYMFSILVFSDWFIISKTEYAILLLACGTVIAGETVNTAIENAVNLASKEKTAYGRIAKDAAAGAVLLSTAFAVLCGIVIMFQPEAFVAMFEYFCKNLHMLAIFIISLVFAFIFIFKGFKSRKEK